MKKDQQLHVSLVSMTKKTEEKDQNKKINTDKKVDANVNKHFAGHRIQGGYELVL